MMEWETDWIGNVLFGLLIMITMNNEPADRLSVMLLVIQSANDPASQPAIQSEKVNN